MNTSETVLVTGASGLVGRAIVRALKARGCTNIWTTRSKTTDLTEHKDVEHFFNECRPDYVFHCAAKVGGISDNIKSPAQFLVENLEIQTNVIRASHDYGAKKLLFLASAAMYPEAAKSPLRPQDLMTGPFDETKSGYAMAKLAGVQMCREYRKQFGDNFISVIPNNIYGPGDRSSHVIPDLLRRFHEAKIQDVSVTCWGSGDARREFIYADDLALACLFLMDSYSGAEPVNIGVNRDWSLRELTELIAKVVGFDGAILWDRTKPEGTQQRLLDSRVMNEYGWTARTCLLDGLHKTYKAICQTLL